MLSGQVAWHSHKAIVTNRTDKLKHIGLPRFIDTWPGRILKSNHFIEVWPLTTEEAVMSLVKIIVITILILLTILLFGRFTL